MIADNLKRFKKFVYDYKAANAATLIFIIILTALLLSRYGALSGISDLSAINPLITSEQNVLVGMSENGEIIKAPKDEVPNSENEQFDNNQKTVVNTPSSPLPAAPSGDSNNSGGSSPPSTPRPFVVGVGQLRHFASGSSGLLGVCYVTHEFKATLHVANPPGAVIYRWYHSDGGTSSVTQASFQAGETSKDISYEWPISASSGTYSIILKTSSPNVSEKKLEFSHQCSLVSL